jgi:hypothetical protein
MFSFGDGHARQCTTGGRSWQLAYHILRCQQPRSGGEGSRICFKHFSICYTAFELRRRTSFGDASVRLGFERMGIQPSGVICRVVYISSIRNRVSYPVMFID